jgi:hypothetical protein
MSCFGLAFALIQPHFGALSRKASILLSRQGKFLGCVVRTDELLITIGWHGVSPQRVDFRGNDK